MTELRAQSRLTSVPQGSVFSAPYWEGCAIGELRFQRCGGCAAALHTPAAVCWRCRGSDLRWERSSGRGVIHSFTVVWRPVSVEFDVPYAPIIVEMEEGWLMLSALVGCDDSEVAIGMEVRVEFHGGPGGPVLPYMRPCD